MVAAFKQAHYDLNRPGQMPLQAALAEFIGLGHFASSLRRARHSYAERRQCLLEALQPCLGERARITGAEQGLHLCLRLHSARTEEEGDGQEAGWEGGWESQGAGGSAAHTPGPHDACACARAPAARSPPVLR